MNNISNHPAFIAFKSKGETVITENKPVEKVELKEEGKQNPTEATNKE